MLFAYLSTPQNNNDYHSYFMLGILFAYPQLYKMIMILIILYLCSQQNDNDSHYKLDSKCPVLSEP